MDGYKSPDYSIYEKDPQMQPLVKAYPTVVWEVAYSENERKLRNDLGRHVACSLGNVRLAIGINIEHNRRTTRGQPGSLKSVTCALWEVDDVQEFASLKASGSQLNTLTRCDGIKDDSNSPVPPPATKFSCVSRIQGTFLKFFVSQKKLYTASPVWSNTVALVLIYIYGYRFSPKTQMGPRPCIFYTDMYIVIRRTRTAINR
jgi:hypothetical protein